MYSSSLNPDSSEQTLMVMSGLHEGARVRLGSEGVTLGGTDECTINFWDSSVQEIECNLSPSGRGTAVVSVKQGSCSVGRKLLRAGETGKLRRGSIIQMGDVRVGFGNSLNEARAVSGSYGFSRIVLSSIGGLAAIIAFSALTGAVGSFAKIERTEASIVVAEDAGSQARDDALAALRSRLADDGITTVDLFGDVDGGRVVASGELHPEFQDSWTKTKRWFDGRYGIGISLIDNLQLPSTEVVLPFSIDGVTDRDQLFVVLHDGTRYAVGDKLPGGWRLDAVETASVRLSRRDEQLTLPF